MGRGRDDRSTNPLAAMMEEGLAELGGPEVRGGAGSAATDEVAQAAGDARAGTSTASAPLGAPVGTPVGTPMGTPVGGLAAGPVRRAGGKPGRRRGGRNSDPNCVPISAKINKDVKYALDRVLAEQSELQGRPVYMAEVIERLMRYYVEHGDPYATVEG